jgi:hypothetical protein
MHLLAPYFALGFDQNMIVRGGARMSVTAGELRSLGHLCNYGRPLCAVFISTEMVAHHVLDGVHFFFMQDATWLL